MYFSETHRLGVKKCSVLAYNLESWGEVFWLYSMPLMLLGLMDLPIVAYFKGWEVLFFLFVPIFLAVSSMFMRGKAQDILDKKGFRYDYEPDKAYIDNELLDV